jgi:2-polyprenyl-3-methyl-5-hydroxy-6-metoxy-1,4-benzoquinol methylase
MQMWNARYAAADFAYGTEPNDFLVAQRAALPLGGRLLCLAEGEGRNAVFLARLGFEVHAVDQSDVGLAKAQRLAAASHVSITTEVADLASYSLGRDQWDGIVSIFAHVPSALRRAVHAQVPSALRIGGVMMIEAYTIKQLDMRGVGGPGADAKDLFMSAAALRSELAPLRTLVGHEVERDVNEGSFHRGRSAVVQWVARRER